MSNAIEFRLIARFPHYKFGSDGSVWSLRENVPLKYRLSKGAPLVTLWEGGKHITKRVSTLIAEAFHGPRPIGLEVCHFPDRDPTNNTPANLRYASHKQNIADQVFHGTRLRGEQSPCCKLTTAKVRRIKRLYLSSKATQVVLAARFDVSQSLISAIVTGVRWAHVIVERNAV